LLNKIKYDINIKVLGKIVIGQIEKINVLSLNINEVVSRIDTGAYLSAIHISSLEQTKNGLEIVFFDKDKNCDYYTGQKVLFPKYGFIKVKSSNGLVEKRYKILLDIQIRGVTLKKWFGLTDRSSMKYPILIGRNVLKGKFLVDVNLPRNVVENKEERFDNEYSNFI